MAGKSVASKLCLKCREVKPVTDFYTNSCWEAQKKCDTVCKECAKKMVHDKKSLRKYFWDNNRLWVEDIWEAAKKKAERIYSVDKKYLDRKTPIAKKREIEERETALASLGVMGLKLYYHFCDNNAGDGEYVEFDADSDAGSLITDVSGKEIFNPTKEYSAKWNGIYSKEEIQYLDEYYEQLESDFVLGDIIMHDYAKKIATASLEVSRKTRMLSEGKCSTQEWQQTQKAFDDLCKSANFAACVRKGGDTNGLGSLSEIIMNVEINHYAECPAITFPEDDIDRILADFAHTEVAIQ